MLLQSLRPLAAFPKYSSSTSSTRAPPPPLGSTRRTNKRQRATLRPSLYTFRNDAATSPRPPYNFSVANHMPTLPGFLKKKRTREGDPSSSAPTSPVTPTAAKPWEGNSLSTTAASSVANTQISQGTHPPTAGATASQQAGYSAHETGNPMAPSQPAMNPMAAHQPAYPTQFQPTPSSESQNLPSISNLINPLQNDKVPPQQQLGFQSPPISQTVSPGTDPSRLPQPPPQPGAGGEGQQQQQPPPPPSHQPSRSIQMGGMDNDQPQYQGQAQDQAGPSTNNATQQYGNQVAHGQPRVTKGKYSLQDFEVLRTLGTGSFGRVHLVQSKHNTRFYAIKVLKKAQVVKMKQVEHTNDERRMLGEVKHPFLVTLWGTFQDSKNLYMVMDFVEGGELFSLLRKSGVRSLHGPHQRRLT